MFEKQIDDSVRLRTLREDDAEELFQVIDENRAHLREWLPWLDANTTPKDSLSFIQATLAQEADNQGFTCAILLQGKIVGVVGYHPIRWSNRSVEIGYWLARAAAGHGIMTKCCRVLISHAFAVYDLNRVQIPAAIGNTRSRAIPERLGFTLEGVIRDAEWLYDHYVDHAMYAMLKKDWSDPSPEL
ncbi:GNAT family N-acetyltransferase, partial [Alkalispirochaeta alkalica]|uniref:GNAT family N-acetyltransferase n=1 Tax=Alkalispirochaeta alkalica TaxID=46356 RepID=UPI00035FB8B7